MKSALIRRRAVCRMLLGAALLMMWVLVTGCESLPLPGNLPLERDRINQLPGVPSNMDEVEDLMRDLGLPDLSRLSDVPGLDTLPQLETPPGTVVFQGPLDQSIASGDGIAGTDIELVDVSNDRAVFRIDGMHAEREIGDSLDFDGAWPNLPGVSYALRLRIYRISNGEVRAAGVHRLTVANAAPRMADVQLDEDAMRFPYTVAAAPNTNFPGLTYGFGGEDDRGAVLTGLAQDEYPYRKLGDSITWRGYVRDDLPVEYHLRMLYYQSESARVGGVVLISLPGQ